MADQVVTINRARGRVKASVTRLASWLQALDVNAVTPQELRVRVRALDDDNVEFYRLQSRLNDLVTADMEADMEREEQEFQDRFFALTSKLKTLIDQKLEAERNANPQAGSQPGGSRAHQQCSVKLPKITLPHFSGRYEDWTSFRDLFTASIHNNTGLSGAEKLQYLNGALTGEASSLIKSIPINDASYTEAWDILSTRYDNKHLIVQSLLRPLFSHPPMKAESASELRRLLDGFVEKTRSLKVLGLPVDSCDFMLVYMITDKMDSESRKQWELNLKPNQLPTFNDVKEFLESRCRALEAAASNSNKSCTTTFKVFTTPKQTTSAGARQAAAHISTSESECALCGQIHKLYKCDQFCKSSASQRRETVKRLKLCFNCLYPGHAVSQCKSNYSCRTCNGRHHSLLHVDAAPAPQMSSLEAEVEASSQAVTVTSNLTSGVAQQTQVLLSTVLVKVTDSRGNPQVCRALMDSGSQASFITASCLNRLGLKKKVGQIQITGVGQTGAGTSPGSVEVVLQSMSSNFTTTIDALVMEKITGILPNNAFDGDRWNHLMTLKLADPYFYKPGQIDILIGADVFANLMLDGKINGPEGSPIAQNTHLGWILSGKMKTSVGVSTNRISTFHCQLDSTLRRFWELEEVYREKPAQSLEEKRCEQHFEETYSRDNSGRYVVRMPFKEGVLGDSLQIAVSSLHQIERRLARQPQYRDDYLEFMKQYENLGHMEELSEEEVRLSSPESNYLPHHFVLKPSSTTTKFRVVFDASRATTSGSSLNDKMMVGPKLQDDLIALILRFRTHKIAFTADIAKMYRQVLLHPDEQDLQRIVWRDDPSKPIKHYRLKTVTYGTAAAPYLATKCLQNLAEIERDNYPLGSKYALRDFFMDDLMSGAADVQQAVRIQQELIQMLAKAGFPLRKWVSNCDEVVQSVPEDYRENKVSLEIGADDGVQALGIHFHPRQDYYTFDVHLPPVKTQVTKRSVLSDIASIFDPIGWLAPVIVVGKLLMQELWIKGCGWDEELDQDISSRWLGYRETLPELSDIQFSRWLISGPSAKSMMLLGFSDASEIAYSAVCYLRVEDSDGNVSCGIVAAKTKVAPIKTVSLPKLELLGATLLTRLIISSKKAMQLNLEAVYAWSDSTITLAWIRGHPNRWKTFVSNRVSEIQDAVPPEAWLHVISEDNPADCASRGLSPADLKSYDLWWHGPKWILQHPSTWSQTKELPSTTLEERTVKAHQVNAEQKEDAVFGRYSSLSRLQRITAWSLRFFWNCQHREQKRMGTLKTEELQEALNILIKKTQLDVFNEDIRCIQNKKSLQSSSKLLGLNPFIDDAGLLRVGGRLQNARLTTDKKFPILLPKSHSLTNLIVKDAHLKHFHAGPTLLLATLRQRFWILCGRDVVRRQIHNCLNCFRDKTTTAQQLMGQLPIHRVQPARAFLHVGVDYAGPVSLRSSKGPGRKVITKGYISVFVCFTTKAIHVEVVSDLTTDAFLAAFRRFISRRGRCSDIYSDCGTNFVGANGELKSFMNQCRAAAESDAVRDQLAMDGIKWHFNPPSSPHFGGLWEAGVKSIKTQLRRSIGETVLTFEELYTVLTQIEACLNSRPLCALSNDPSDMTCLTPGHFLIGEPLSLFPEPSLLEINSNRLSRWQHLQQIQQHFWKRWQQEYLTSLQQRPKWRIQKDNVEIGDLVLLKDDRLPPLKWSIGRIVDTFTGPDGRVRVVNLRTPQGILKRPVVKLCPLPTN